MKERKKMSDKSYIYTFTYVLTGMVETIDCLTNIDRNIFNNFFFNSKRKISTGNIVRYTWHKDWYNMTSLFI